MKRNVSIVDFVTDPQLLGLSISQPQETLLRSIYGLPLSGSRQDIWQQCTGRETYPRHGFSEATIICGARSGKDSRIATPIGAFEASLGDHEKHLAKGERAVIPLVAQDMRGSKITFSRLPRHSHPGQEQGLRAWSGSLTRARQEQHGVWLPESELSVGDLRANEHPGRRADDPRDVSREADQDPEAVAATCPP